MILEHLQWWSGLRHGGLLLDTQRLSDLMPQSPVPLRIGLQEKFRKEMTLFQQDQSGRRTRWVSFVLEQMCGFHSTQGAWHRGSNIDHSWTRPGLLKEAIRPNHLWQDSAGGILPVFIDSEARLGIGKGKRILAQVLQWLRRGREPLALVTNGTQWRIVFAGLDYDAFCEWELDKWVAEGRLAPDFDGFRTLVSPALWVPAPGKTACPLLEAIQASRKGQSDLSQELGERVRKAAEALIQGHTPVLNQHRNSITPQEIYRAAVHVIMRMVVVLFAESRENLLPRDNTVYQSSYSLQGLREALERVHPYRRLLSYSAYPRLQALFRLVHQGCDHEAMPVPTYGGELFAPGDADSPEGMKRALHIFETACFRQDLMHDEQVREMLDYLTRTQVYIRQGRTAFCVPMPVDFSSLASEYIGILYEGLLDYELRCALDEQPIVFLEIGNSPALPLSTLEGMNDSAIKNLFEKLKDTSSDSEPEDEDAAEEEEDEETVEEPVEVVVAEAEHSEPAVVQEISQDDPRFTLRARAENWARRACEVAGLVSRPRGRMTPERTMQFQKDLDSKARQIVSKVVLPGEWYLVRWGGTRKGSGTFYTRPPLAVPTVNRTLRPLAYDPPLGENGQPNGDAPAADWTAKKPEEILGLKVCDPACGSGSFCLAALRFLTAALYESLRVHQRIRGFADRSVLDLIYDRDSGQCLKQEDLPCRSEDDDFEVRTLAVLRRYVVERCIYGVDLDPLSVELTRLSLWIETLDRRLKMAFLQHKIKVGNSLVGAWFDRFQHYPAMAWEREGGDKNHGNGVHYEKEKWTKKVAEKKKQVKTELIHVIDHTTRDRQMSLEQFHVEDVRSGHSLAETALREIHDTGIGQVEEREVKYDALRHNPEFRRLKDAFDLWCAVWYWPPDQIDQSPTPQDFYSGSLSDDTRALAQQVAAERRFFHWELEFPDVFNQSSQGFDAVLGNPPWETSKPNSKEFFSAVDPMYRGYGKQEALNRQQDYFTLDPVTEHRWLLYNAYYRAMSNWVKYAGFPFGDRVTTGSNGRPSHDLNLGTGGANSFINSQFRHARWAEKRLESFGFADPAHVFRYQGSGDINLYKSFLEQAHALLHEGGRMGFIVPSGIYSDYGTSSLRELFIDHCRWEWIFGFENREGIFDIHRSFKFNPVIIQKGGETTGIRTAFMRRNLADWEKGEDFVTEYPRERILQFSPLSRAILEIQSRRDLEVLEKIYSNSILLGDQSEKGWGIKYTREFDMTNNSKLFPPRTVWEEWGYRPDEYSRWIKGPWKPVAELWAELGVSSLPEGEPHLAQPPYNLLPVPRADLPAGVILSREATHYIREEEIPEVTFTDAQERPLKIKVEREDGKKVEVEVRGPAVALPLYQGKMIWQYDYSFCGFGINGTHKWVENDWNTKNLTPRYLLAKVIANKNQHFKILMRDVSSPTNRRTFISSIVPGFPSGHKTPTLDISENNSLQIYTILSQLNSFWFDHLLRLRFAISGGGGSLIKGMVYELPLLCAKGIPLSSIISISKLVSNLIGDNKLQPVLLLNILNKQSELIFKKNILAQSNHERMRIRCLLEAINYGLSGIGIDEIKWFLKECDYPTTLSTNKNFTRNLNPKGFWRVDKDKSPEHRLTVLSLVAFHDLQKKVAACGGDMEKGIEAFCNQNGGEGWMLPETVRLVDYGLGHDDRAQKHQPVRECFGPRFYPWQLAQSAEESWRECHLHARNLLGAEGYRALLDELEGKTPEPTTPLETEESPSGYLLDISYTPLLQQ